MVSARAKIVFWLSFVWALGLAPMVHCGSDSFPTSAAFYAEQLDRLPPAASKRASRQDCAAEYASFFPGDALDITIYFGIMDAPDGRPLDRSARHALVSHLTDACIEGYHACGFSITEEEPYRLIRQTADARTVTIAIHDSSVSEDSTRNGATLSEQQLEKSDAVTRSFLESLEDDDVIFYIGHSRLGTGPGFYGPATLSGQWLDNYVQSPLLPAVTRQLEQSPSPPGLLAFFGCSTQRHFAEPLHAAAPGTALLLSTHMTYYDESLVAAVDAINSLLGNICYADGGSSVIRINESSDYNLYGLFPSNDFPDFPKHLSMLSLVIYIFLLPLFVFALPKTQPKNLVIINHPRIYLLYLALLLLLPVVSAFLANKTIAQSKELGIYTIPFFFFFTGLLLTFMFLLEKRSFDILKDVFKYTATPLLGFALLYFVVQFALNPGPGHLPGAVAKFATYWATSLLMLPLCACSTHILLYPLSGDLRLMRANRVLLFLVTGVCFCAILVVSTIYLNIQLLPFRGGFFFVLLYCQLATLALHKRYKLPVSLQAATLSLLFTENLHGLFY